MVTVYGVMAQLHGVTLPYYQAVCRHYSMHFLTGVLFASDGAVSKESYRNSEMDEARTGSSNKSGQGRAQRKKCGTTIQRCENNADRQTEISNMCKAHLGRKPLLTAVPEKELADHVLLLATVFFGMTQTELR
jgi:hypothetical protein